ncbi:MAG: hypothetical protein JRJ21_00185 [Deltaproteobacteria bacterium]|jgi:hypothetical protein|nr:hypothetical protein [Deltaproteobacteria bacterium]
MAIRTVRLDSDGEQLLDRIVQTSGMSISAAFKEGLRALEGEIENEKGAVPYAIYKELDLGPGGYCAAPSSDAKKSVKDAIRRKLGQ